MYICRHYLLFLSFQGLAGLPENEEECRYLEKIDPTKAPWHANSYSRMWSLLLTIAQQPVAVQSLEKRIG